MREQNMIEGKHFSLIDIKSLSKPLTKLIDSVSKGIGRIYKPADTVIQAHADAKAVLIHAQAEIHKNELIHRASERMNFVEARRQNNIDAIVFNASQSLPSEVASNKVDEDWIADFFESCKDVGNPEMQQIWGKILAAEVAAPETYSRRTLALVKTLSKRDAQKFSAFSSYIFETGKGEYGFIVPPWEVFRYLRPDTSDEDKFSTSDEVHLMNIGLLSSTKVYIPFESDADKIEVNYFNETIAFKVKKGTPESEGYIEIFPLTEVGNELVAIAGGKADPEFLKVWRSSKNSTNSYMVSPKATKKAKPKTSGSATKNSQTKQLVT